MEPIWLTLIKAAAMFAVFYMFLVMILGLAP